MSIINYDNQQAQLSAQQESAQREQRNRAVWEEILARWPVTSHLANYAMVKEYCSGQITVPKFKFLVNNPPDGFTLDWTDEREELLRRILGLLYDPYGRRMTEHDLQQAKKRMSTWTRQQLRARLQDWKQSRR